MPWTSEWLVEMVPGDGDYANDEEHPGREYSIDLGVMVRSDVTKARAFLDAFVRGERIVLTPQESDQVKYQATGDLSGLVGHLISARKRNPHHPVPSPGSPCPRNHIKRGTTDPCWRPT